MNDKPRIRKVASGYWWCYTSEWMGQGPNMVEAWLEYVESKHTGMKCRAESAQKLRERIDRAVALETPIPVIEDKWERRANEINDRFRMFDWLKEKRMRLARLWWYGD